MRARTPVVAALRMGLSLLAMRLRQDLHFHGPV